MNKEELLKLGLSEENADKILGKYGHLIPKSRLDEVIEERNKLRDEIQGLKSEDVEALKKQVKELAKENEKKRLEYESNLNKTKIENLINLELTKSGAINSKAVKALIDGEKIKLENENISGLTEQLEELKKTDGYLFKKGESEPRISGLNPAKNNGAPSDTRVTLASAISNLYKK